MEALNMKAKKTTTLNGTLMYPLEVGRCALIFHNGQFIRTSRVVEIHHAAREEVWFETMNTIYRLLLLPGPAPMAAEQPMLCMAA